MSNPWAGQVLDVVRSARAYLRWFNDGTGLKRQRWFEQFVPPGTPIYPHHHMGSPQYAQPEADIVDGSPDFTPPAVWLKGDAASVAASQGALCPLPLEPWGGQQQITMFPFSNGGCSISDGSPAWRLDWEPFNARWEGHFALHDGSSVDVTFSIPSYHAVAAIATMRWNGHGGTVSTSMVRIAGPHPDDYNSPPFSPPQWIGTV